MNLECNSFYITSFIGRCQQIQELRELLATCRLVTVNGPGGVGKTRLAIEISRMLEYPDGTWIVDLAPVADPTVVPTIAAHALGLMDQPNRTMMNTLSRFIGERRMLMVLDNCEHLVTACRELVVSLLTVCPGLTILATSRESLGVAGEIVWCLPSLSVADEAIQLFVERARLVQPTFEVTDQKLRTISKICHRLDGIPLAIELAAARVRSLSLTQIADSLDDRFRLLTGGLTAIPRQQTLRGSMDWSHNLLSESEQVVFRRLAVFPSTFDLAAVVAVAGDGREPFAVLDQLTMLVDKSLVAVEKVQRQARYCLLESVREYAAEKLVESGEVGVWKRHADYYTQLAASLETPASNGGPLFVEVAETELENFRAAFMWNRKEGHISVALSLASLLQPVWLGRGRQHEGLAWLDSILGAEYDIQSEIRPGVWARALADRVLLSTLLASTAVGAPTVLSQAHQALALAREVGDPAVLTRALVACGWCSGYDPIAAQEYFGEAMEVARTIGDRWSLNRIRYWRLASACIAGDPTELRGASDQAFELADAIGDRFVARQCRLWACAAYAWEGYLADALERCCEVTIEAEDATDIVTQSLGLYLQAWLSAHKDGAAALVAADACVKSVSELGKVFEDCAYSVVAYAALAAGDIGAIEAYNLTVEHLAPERQLPVHHAVAAQLALIQGDVATAQRLADQAVNSTSGWHLMMALKTRAHIAIAQERLGQARDDAHAAVNCGVKLQAYLGMPDLLEVLAHLGGEAGSHHEAVRLLGASAAQREHTGEVRFKVWDGDYEALVARLRSAIGGQEFDSAWTEGNAMSIDEAIAYAQRGRGKRTRPATGWASLTPAEHNVVNLVTKGMTNKEIAKKLFLSPRTVQTHLTKIYGKLNITSRVQLTQQAARHR